MNTHADIGGGKPRLRPLVAGRIRSTAFAWQPILNLSTREPARVRFVSRGWRAWLLDSQ